MKGAARGERGWNKEGRIQHLWLKLESRARVHRRRKRKRARRQIRKEKLEDEMREVQNGGRGRRGKLRKIE